MRLFIENEFDVTTHEFDDGRIEVTEIRFVGCNQNLMPFMSKLAIAQAQARAEDTQEQAAIAKVELLLERKAMACDSRREIAREFQQEALAERQAQRGVRI